MRNYSDPEYKKWRKNIYERDHWKCQWPDCGKGKVQAHHIYRWNDFPGLRYHPDNGISLCKYHHKLITGNEDAYIQLFMKINKEKKR